MNQQVRHIVSTAVLTGALLAVSCTPRAYVPRHPTSGRVLSAVDTIPSKLPVADEQKPVSDQSIDFSAAIDPNNVGQDSAVLDNNSAAPISHSFGDNETEHIKFSRYNPFGSSGSFSVELDGLDYCYPIDGKFSSGYGRRGRSFHTGVDLIAPAHTPIYAIFDGTVRMSKPYSGYGNVVVLRHDNGLETVYAHTAKNLVRVGQQVKRGDKIAICGRTGRATTNHLHFEVRVQGIAISPLLVIDPMAHTLKNGTLTITRSSGGSVSARLGSVGQQELARNQTEDKVVADAKSNTADHDQANQDPTPHKEALANASHGIRVGDKVYDAPSTPAATTKPAASSYHIVVRGNTMSAIARRYSISVSKICALNNIPKDKADKLKLGQKLRVR
ncbi:MAG: M23 family metallopeptidase [Mucinivorans sp.]